MNKIVLFYGSSTGTCENLARDIAEKLNLDSSVVHPVSELNEKTVAAADTLLLGTSTWGWGDIQDDWTDALPKLKAMSLSGKKIALFGCGDSSSYGDTFCDGMGILYDELKESGCTWIGTGVSTDDYQFNSSKAVIDNAFVGLAIDDINQNDKTEERINSWITLLKTQI